MKKILSLAILLCAAGLFLVSCQNKGATGPAGAKGIDLATIVLQNNTELPIDFYNPNQNYAGDSILWVGFHAIVPEGITYTSDYFRTLFKCDLSTIIPPNGIVEDASLILYPYNNGSQYISGTTTITAYTLSSPWEEKYATWISSTASTMWTNPGGDYDTITAFSDTVVLSDANIPTSVTFNLSTSVVQGWLTNPLSNNGFIFKASNETITAGNYFTFYSTDNGTTSLNPVLKLHYKLP